MPKRYTQTIYHLVLLLACPCFCQALDSDLEEEKEDLEEHPPITRQDVLNTIAWSTTPACFDQLFKPGNKIPLKTLSQDYSKTGVNANKHFLTWQGRDIRDEDDIRRELCYHLGCITCSIHDEDIKIIKEEHTRDEETKGLVLSKQGHVYRSMYLLNDFRTHNDQPNQSMRAPLIIFIAFTAFITCLLVHTKLSKKHKIAKKPMESEGQAEK